MAASTSNNPSFIVEVKDEYPYPSHVIAPNFVTVKLSNKNKYNVWKIQMQCLLSSHGMLGFIDGTFVCPDDDQNGKESVVGDMKKKAWIRSDSLVKGWILGSLSEEVAIKVVNHLTWKHKESDFTAKHTWDELQTSYYGPSIILQKADKEVITHDGNLKHEKAKLEVEITREGNSKPEDAKLVSEITIEGNSSPENAKSEVEITIEGNSKPEDAKSEEELEEKDDVEEKSKIQSYSQTCYQKILKGDIHFVREFIDQRILAYTDIITKNGNTTLHVAVVSSANNNQILREFLEMIPTENSLLDLVNSDGSTLLHVAATVVNTVAACILMERDPEFLLAKDNEGHTPLAVSILNLHADTSESLLKYIALQIDAEIPKDPMSKFSKDTKYHRTLFSGTSGDELLVQAISTKQFRLARELLSHYKTIHSEAVLMAIAQNFPSEPVLERRGVWPFTEERLSIRHDASVLSWRVCRKIGNTTHHNHCYTNPVFEATRLNAFEVVKDIALVFPNTIPSTNEDGYNFIQYAVINRSEKVYNLLYQMSENKNIYKTIKDSSGNNLLHLAARLAPPNKLNLISGAALQLQRELQWFKEVEGFVSPLNIIQKNSLNETPEMVFTSQHKDLVIEGEKWMKATAESYTITAALITTVVFASAITVPGGNKDTGVPNFSRKAAFIIFAISDAISLFTAVTSLLMFLSILTTRFAQQDFLFKLPKRLIIGLTALFISTTAMIIAFGATLLLVFGQKKSWILIPIGVLSCLPITSFVSLQYPLIADLMRTTYGPSIFVKKKSHDYFY